MGKTSRRTHLSIVGGGHFDGIDKKSRVLRERSEVEKVEEKKA
jgi:hypothetical protein